MDKQKIRVQLTRHAAHTAYIALPGYRKEPGIVSKSLTLGALVKDYSGPSVNLDFGKDGRLIGIEILVYPSRGE